MERRTRVESIKRKPFQFRREGVVVKKSPKAGYVIVRFNGDKHNTPMKVSDLKVVGQTTIGEILEEKS